MIRKTSSLTKAKGLLNKLNTLDANFLVGKVPTEQYKKRRASLNKEFVKLKKSLR